MTNLTRLPHSSDVNMGFEIEHMSARDAHQCEQQLALEINERVARRDDQRAVCAFVLMFPSYKSELRERITLIESENFRAR